MTGLYWSTLLNCRAHANIHIVVIRCIFNCLFECIHTAVSFCCVYFITERKARNIYLLNHPIPNAAQVRLNFALKRCVSSLKLHPGAELHSCATAPCWSNRSIAGFYIRSYEIKRLLDDKNICPQFFIVDVVDNVD